MKRFLLVFALFAALILVIGCGGEEEETESVSGDTATDKDSAETGDDADSTAQPDENGEADETPDGETDDKEGRKRGELYGECYPNKTCNKGLVCDTENNTCIKEPENSSNDGDSGDDTDSTADEDANPDNSQSDDDSDNKSAAEKICNEAGGKWNEAGISCTKQAECKAKPEHTQWNGDSTYTMSYSNGEWSSEIDTEYGEETGTCRYKCDTGFFREGSNCVNPCDANPCENVANSTKVCTATDAATYSCGCKGNYAWNASECIPECSASTTTFPCYDSTSHLTWSKKADTTYNWSGAGRYCNGLSEGGYSDWHLPTISELRTLIQNCSGTQMPGGSCGVRDEEDLVCLAGSCRLVDCHSCTSDSTGGHSKFGDTDWFWSSSARSDNLSNAWDVNFKYGYVNNTSKGNGNGYVRCVRGSQ